MRIIRCSSSFLRTFGSSSRAVSQRKLSRLSFVLTMSSRYRPERGLRGCGRGADKVRVSDSSRLLSTMLSECSRKGFQEERDSTRLRDGRARAVACYACGGSSIPIRSLTSDPESSWRQIVSCDYCALHWHLDCLDPPLACMPNSGRKWMCPNHADLILVGYPSPA